MALLPREWWQANPLTVAFILQMHKPVSAEAVAEWVWCFYGWAYYNSQGLFN